jgi:cyanophycin synthetase
MKIVETRVMRGPNYWSVKQPRLIVLKLDLTPPSSGYTHQLPGFAEKLLACLPGLGEHPCPAGHAGGFPKSLADGTHLGHVVERIALQLQTLAGMPCRFGQSPAPGADGRCEVTFEYALEEAGRYAAEAAVAAARALAAGEDYVPDAAVAALRDLYADYCLGPSTEAIVNEARRRGIPALRLDNASLVQLGYGARQQRIQASISSRTCAIAVDIACSKEATKSMLRAAAVPVPAGCQVRTESELDEAVAETGFPLVVKPADGNQGKGATIGITTPEAAREAFRRAQAYSKDVIVETFVRGSDFRLLVVNYRFVAAALRTPASVTGDGQSTVGQLVDRTNADPNRGAGHEKVLTTIKVDDESRQLLAEAGLGLDSVVPAGQMVPLKRTANLSTGGTSTDVTGEVHPDNIAMAERIARTIGLDICGIDVMAPDIRTPITENGGAVLEVNAAPGLRMHLAPAHGRARNVAAPIIDMLFPGGNNGRIPVVAVTGTNGKTTTTRLIAHLFASAGKKVGFTTTDGVYLHGQRVQKGDCTGPVSAQMVLRDPTVDFAVLECARGGLLRAGLGFDRCDVGIVTNVAEDHLGLDGIHSLDQMSRVKATVAESVAKNGYALLNADNEWTYAMGRHVRAKVGLFSLDAQNPRILLHCAADGLAAVVEDGEVVICDGLLKMAVMPVAQIPLTFGGTASCMTENVLPAVLTGYVRGLALEQIRQGLLSFVPSPRLTPGRLNVFQFGGFQVVVDYAHNPAGMMALGTFVVQQPATRKVGIIAGIGDRREEDTIQLGRLAGQIFDEIIIRLDQDLRGKPADTLVDLLKRGIALAGRGKLAKVIPSETEAIRYAIAHARPGSIIVDCSESVEGAIRTVEECLARERRTAPLFEQEDRYWESREAV